MVLPTYNEKENIGPLLTAIFKQDPRLQVLVVDDGSPDGTAVLVKELQNKFGGRLHLDERAERGRGSAVVHGFKKAIGMGATCVFEMDADFSHNPEDLPRFLKEIKDVDVVVGSRFVRGGGVQLRGWFRNFLSWVINTVIRLILNLKVRDASGGFRCFRAEALKQLDFDQFLSKNYSLCPELLFRLSRNGARLKEMPIVFLNRQAGKSKANFNIAADYLLTVFKIRIYDLFKIS